MNSTSAQTSENRSISFQNSICWTCLSLLFNGEGPKIICSCTCEWGLIDSLASFRLVTPNYRLGCNSLLFAKLQFCITIRTNALHLITQTLSLKGTLMQISKFCSTFVLIEKTVSHILRIKAPFNFWDMRILDMQNVCLQT